MEPKTMKFGCLADKGVVDQCAELHKDTSDGYKWGFEVIDCKEADPVEEVKRLTDGAGADAVIVAVGATSANSQALEMIKQMDGKILLFAAGYPVPELHVDSNTMHYRRIELIGTFGAVNEDFNEAAKALSSGVIDVSKLVESKKIYIRSASGCNGRSK